MELNQDTCFNETVIGEILNTDVDDDGDSGLESVKDLDDPLLSRSTDESNNKPPGVMSILCLVALKRRLWLLPILTSGWLFSSFWTSYAIAVSYNHTEANFPYISHTAIEAPERCVFGQMVNIGAVMLGMNVILRYLFCKKYLLLKNTPPEDRWFKINLAGLVLGILSAFGLSMVANFQTQVQRGPHYFGAGLAFGLGTVYCWFQTALTYQVRYKFNKKKFVLLGVQFANSLIMSLMLVTFSTTKAIYKIQLKQGKGTKWDTLRVVYLTSTITEWLLALSILTFTLTYAPDFKNMRVDDPTIYLEKMFEKKHSSVYLKNMADNNSNIQTAIPGDVKVVPGDVIAMEEGQANDDFNGMKDLTIVANGNT